MIKINLTEFKLPPFVYKTKPKGPPSFSGRSQAKLAQNLAMYQRTGPARAGQQKQKKGK